MKKLTLVIPLLFLFIHLMYADDGPNVWSKLLDNAGPIWGIAVNPTNQDIVYAGSNTTGMYKTTNAGVNWTQINSGLTNTVIQAVAISASNPNIVMCGTTNTGSSPGMYKSTDAGATWTSINNGITQTPIGIQAVAISPTNPNVAYIGVWDGSTTINASIGIFKTTDGGANWFASNTGMGQNKNILSIAINPLNPNTVYCGTSFFVPSTGPTFVYKSYDAGATWTSMSSGLPALATDVNPVRALSISNVDTSVVLAGLFMNTTTNGGAFLTTNGGTLWVKRHTGMPNIAGTLIRSDLIRPGTSTEFFCGIGNATNTSIGVYRTTNAGVLWTDFNGGTMNQTNTIRALAFRTTIDSTLYAGGAHPTFSTDQGVFGYSFIPVGISNNNNNVPSAYALFQNFPNPFNPATFIRYDVPKQTLVRIDVFDASGRVVNTLVNEPKAPGSYEVVFDASSLSSGVYFYRITAGDFADTKKLVLIK